VKPVTGGGAGLKDAINEALRDWTERLEDTFYVFGTAAGPHPYPTMVKAFQRVIGDEIRNQLGHAPRAVVACVGGGSNAIGAFAPFIADPEVRLFGAEPGGEGVETGRHGAALTAGRPGSLHGAISYVLQSPEGQITEPHSVSAGLDYPGVGPEHAHLHATARVEYRPVTDAAALDAFRWLCRQEGILPALETAHAVALALELKGRFRPEDDLVINLSGRGDKDLTHAMTALEALGGAP
jgi:tryptophan synthase beta chain